MKTKALLCQPWTFVTALLIQVFLQPLAQSQTFPGAVRTMEGYGRIPLHFEPNVGQTDPGVRYLTRGAGYTMYFSPGKVSLAVNFATNQEPKRPKIGQKPKHETGLIQFKLEGANSDAIISGEEELPGKFNYFIGNDPAKWRSNIQTFSRVRYQEVYPGIDAVFYGNQSHLEYDFVVSPHADPRIIKMRVEGADEIEIDPQGDLILRLRGHVTRLRKPVVYQTIDGHRQEVAGAYRLNGKNVGFALGQYNRDHPLIIDPVLSYSTFLGGVSAGMGIFVDSSGCAYVCGIAYAAMSLITPGAYQTNIVNDSDAFVAKLNPSGTGVHYMTYIGGGRDDIAYEIAVDRGGNACVVGHTYSGSWPLQNALDPNHDSTMDITGEGFAAKLNTNGSALIYSTYLGGKYYDAAAAVAVDAEGNAYVSGYGSENFPTTNAFQAQVAGGSGTDVFVSKINSNGTAFVYSTLFGAGNGGETGQAIAIDEAGNVYVSGDTSSSNFPRTNAFQATYGGGTADGFVFKLSANGRTNLFSSFIGGNKYDICIGIGVDTSGNIFVAGKTESANFPTTNALQSTINAGANQTSTDGFVTKISPSGQRLFSTFLGGANNDDANAAAIQSNGDVILVGQTGSIDFAPYNNYGSINHGGFDAFVAKLNSEGTVLMNFAYLGGTNVDGGNEVALDSGGNAYVIGPTKSPDFPISSTNVADSTYNGAANSWNAYVTKLYFEPNQLGTRVTFSWNDGGDWGLQPATTLAASTNWLGINGIASVTTNGVTSLNNARYQRGVSYDPTHTSFIIPLSAQTGVRLDDLGDNTYKFGLPLFNPWFTHLQNDVRTHLTLLSSTNVSGIRTSYYSYATNFSNPIAVFGASAGCSPLYFNTQIKFGVYCGEQYESTNSDGTVFQSPLRILVYRLADYDPFQTNIIGPIATNLITLPRRTIAADQTAWNRFASNGFSLTIETNGLRTTVQLADQSSGAWGVTPRFANGRSGTYIITHEAVTNAGYGYVVEGVGAVPLGTNFYPMVTNVGGVAWDRLYVFDFSVRSPWQSIFIDQPHFDGKPLPASYQGASVSELTNMNAVITNSISLTGSIYTNLDYSPELRRHPILDKFVRDMNNDPILLANYVLNRIDLTDALAYNENNGQASASVVNQGGINRGALGVFLEGQGSPVEQCALLVYLLRQAGHPAALVFPTNNNVQLEDARLSKLLRMQLHGAIDQYGQAYTTNTAITVNYPWVVTSISNNPIHIFPWLKDTEIVEGLNLYDYMPTNYDTGAKWLRNYLYGDTNILALYPLNDAPSILFPKFVKQQLMTNAPGISLDDIGVRAYNRQRYYSRWQDFPTPTVVANQSHVICVDSLTSPGITNVSPSLTNIFNTVSITIYSLDSTNTQMTVGPLRLADLHNREMLVFSNSNGLNLWLAPFVHGITNQSAFDDPTLTNKQVQILAIGTNDVHFAIRMTHNRHRAIDFTPATQFLGIAETLQFTTPDRPFNLPDVTALCFNVGRVSSAMLDLHASAYQETIYQWSLNTNATPPVEDYQGAATYLMGMDYYAKVSQFLPLNEQLHKTRVVSWFAEGLAKLTPVSLGAQNFMRPSLDMFFSEIAHAGNGSIHLDSGNDYLAATEDFSRILTAEIAAQEHSLLNGFYLSTNSVSSVVLLRLAQLRATNNVAGILELHKNNYLTVGNTNALGYGPTKLKDYDADIWNAVTNAFQAGDADYVRAYVTPGPVSVSAATYRGMGLVIVGKTQSASLISVNMNGALGEVSSFFGDAPTALSTVKAASLPSSTYSPASTADFSVNWPPLGSGNVYLGDPSGSSSDFTWTYASFGGYGLPIRYRYSVHVRDYGTAQGIAAFTSPSQINLAQQINVLNYYPQSTPTITTLSRALSSGNTGLPTIKNSANHVLDPVDVISGEFYHDSVDLTLAGPQPLQLRRNYSSHNLGDRNGFGYGWNISVVPYIGIATNATTNVILTAVDLDGSVVAYRQQTNDTDLYVPTVQDNPQLDNFVGGLMGSVNNRFNAKIRRSIVGTNEAYTLTGADGQVRTYVVTSFPIYGPTNSVSRERPYLSTWRDTEGNSWSFSYGNDPDANDYGSLVRIQCSNGNFLGLNYNAAGYVTEAYTGDGQRATYEYDDFGDLVRAVRPDASEEMYEYQHTQFTNNNVIYIDSTHLLAKEIKPDGRLLQNIYDAQRRVVVQLATVGTDMKVYTNGIFTYSNNFVMPLTNALSGYTLVKDVNGNTNRYDYTNGLITLITDPLNQTIQQNWYTDATAVGYPRSLWQVKDKRNRWTEFQYDAYGNATNSFTWGDLLGDGATVYATNSMRYDSNNLPILMTDAIGNSVQIVYDPQYSFLPQQIIRLAGAVPVLTNRLSYYNTTNVVVNGNLTLTNIALGLLRQSVRAFGSQDASTNEWSFDGRGFITQQVQHTGTGDPTVTNTFYCNNRGEIIERMDAAGRRTAFAYDGMGRPILQQVFESNQSLPLFWNNVYYNGNGDVTWNDGPRFNPEDYVWRDYDGAGRLIAEIHWRSEAKNDGSGVQAPTNSVQLFAQSFREYDKFGNLTRTIDPRTASVENSWDALGRLTKRQFWDTGFFGVLQEETFGYEPGGLVRFYTNMLGGFAETQYTTDGKPKYRRNLDGSTNAWRYYLDGRLRRDIQRNGAYWETSYDDANLRTTRIFYSALGSPLATNTVVYDQRGNQIQTSDTAGNTFTNFFDDLDRLKAAVGPASESIVENCGQTPNCGVYVTNIFQPAITNYYDAAGVAFTNVNALGEKSISFFDALGRPTRVEIRDAANTLARETSFAYSRDFHSVTVTNGSGSSAIVSTTYTDNDGRVLISAAYPSANMTEYIRNAYDLSGNLTYQAHASASNGVFTEWSRISSWWRDGLNRIKAITTRDSAFTWIGYYDISGTREVAMPNDVRWLQTHNAAGQLVSDKDSKGGAVTRTNSYSYYPAGHPWAGLLQARADGRGVTCTYTYDDWLRVATNTHAGPLNEQNLTTIWQYEARGLATNISQSFAAGSTGPSTAIRRTYDAYGQPTSETVSVGENTLYGVWQSWNEAGRRTILGLGSGYGFTWRPDGLLTSATLGTLGTGIYGYDAAGLLTNRIVGPRATSIASRDGAGRPLSVITKINAQTKLTETLTWTADGLPSTHTLAREDFTDSRQFFYANLTRFLAEERLNLDATKRWTNIYTFDSGAANGPGVLTGIGQTSSSSHWSGTTDVFSRISTETNTASRQLAHGRVNGPAAITALLDGAAQPVTVINTGDQNWTNQWRATMEMTPGAHQLTVTAVHASGLFATNTTVWFTNNLGNLTVTDSIDGAGNLTQRIWRKPNGTTNLVQTLAWDGRGRLHKVAERDSDASGRDLTIVYDVFGRRLQTTEIPVTNNVALTNQPIIVSHYFDPEVEFLELGVNENGKTTWKLIGPDLNGIYGGQNGTGGFEAEATSLTFSPVVGDAFGNILARYDQNALTWNSSRLTGYGGVPGYQPLTLGSVGSLAAKYTWRNRASESVGLSWLGDNWIDPVSGRFLAFDSFGHYASDSGYSFCSGSPYALWDSDGRIGKGRYAAVATMANGLNQLVKDAYFSASYGISALVYGRDRANEWYGQNWQGLRQTVTGSAQTVYDAGALGSYALVSLADNDLAYRAYGPSMNRLEGAADAFRGGGDKSAGYQYGYTTANIGLMLLPTRWANAGRLGETAQVTANVATRERVLAIAESQQAVRPGQVASPHPPNRRVGGRGESVRPTDPRSGFREAGAWDLTPDNLRLMETGRPPIGRDGLPVELHHRNQNPLGPLDEMSSTTHDSIAHPISPSQINRSEFAGERARYWRQRARQLLGQE